MKLHLPKLLLTAVMAVVMAMPALAFTVTNADGTTTITSGEWSQNYKTDSLYTNGVGGRWQINGGTPSTQIDGTKTIVVGNDNGQLFLQLWGTGAATLNNAMILGGGGADGYGTIRFGNDGADTHTATLNGAITLIEDATFSTHNSSVAININSAITSVNNSTLTVQGKGYVFSGAVNVAGLTLKEGWKDNPFASNIVFNDQSSVTVGNLTVGSNTTASFAGSLTIGGTIKNSGSLSIAKTINVESWENFDFTFTGGEDATDNGLVGITKTYQILSGNALAEGSTTEFTYGDDKGNIADGYVQEGSAYVIAKDSVTVDLTDADSDAARADVLWLKEGTLNLAAGSLSTELVRYTGGSVNLSEGTSYTGLDSVADAALISSITGSGTLYIAETVNAYGGTITTSNDFTGKVYVTSGNFTLNGTTHGETIQLAEGVNMQITSDFEFEKSMILDSGNHQIHTNGNILTISGNVSGGGTLEKVASGSITIADGATIANYKHSAGITNVTGGSVTNMTISGSGDGTKVNVTGGQITAITLNNGADLTFSLADGQTQSTIAIDSIETSSESNRFQRDITVDAGVKVTANRLKNAWGMGALTVNGNLEVSGELNFTAGANGVDQGNKILGAGSIKTNTFVLTNEGTYSLNVAELTVTSSSNITRQTYVKGGKVNLAALNLSADLRVQGGEVSMTGTTGNGGKITGEAGIINMVGGTHTLGTLDLSNDGTSTAQVNLSNSAALSVNTLWGASNSAINVGEGSSVTASGVKVIGTANATTIAASQNSKYGADKADFTITNATVEVAPAAESTTTLGNKIVDSNVTNTGAGELIVSDMTVTDASMVQSALTGDMTVTKLTLASGLSETVAAVTTSGALTLGSISLDLTEYSAGNYTLVSATGDGSIIWDATAENALSYTGTLGEGLEASVDFGSDNKTLQLTISEMVTPGESLITTTVVEKQGDDFLYSLDGTTLTLTVEKSLAGLAEGGIVELDLISDEMKAAILASLTNPETGKVTEMVTLKLTDGNTDNDIIAGEDAIVGFFNEKNEGYFGENVGNGVQYNVNLIPEPTTATLSLLALMGLAARRRRQK